MTASVNERAELIALLSAAYKQCLKLHRLFLEVAEAPHHLKILSRDLQDSYLILRTLYTLTSDEESPSHFIESAISGNLRSVINDCLLIFVDVNSILVELQAGRRNSDQDWQDENPRNKTSEILLLHDNLRGIKAVLNIAIYQAGSYSKPYSYHDDKDNDTIERVTEAVQKLEVSPTESQYPKESKGNPIPEPGARETSRDEVREGLKPPVLEFIWDSYYLSSGLRSLLVCSWPQTSSGAGNGNDSNKLYIAQATNIVKGRYRHLKRECTQIFVRHPSSNRSIALQVGPEYTIASIKALVRRRIMMPNACFVLAQSKRLLPTLDKSLRRLKILHNATLTCVSFRPNSSSSPFPSRNYMGVCIKFLSNDQWKIRVEKDHTILKVKEYIASRLNNDISHNHIRLIYAGHVLEDGRSIFKSNIGHKSMLHVVFHKAVLDKVRHYQGVDAGRAPTIREWEPGDGELDPKDHNSTIEDQELEDGDQESEVEDRDSRPDTKDPEIGA